MTNPNPNPATRFQSGYDPRRDRAGRKPGSDPFSAERLREAMLQATDNAGFVMEVPTLDNNGKEIGRQMFRGAGGLVGYLTWAAMYRANAFIAQLGRIIPAEVNAKIEKTFEDVTYRTVEEITIELKAAGYNDEKINFLLEDLRK
jgi:hypothetical protein